LQGFEGNKAVKPALIRHKRRKLCTIIVDNVQWIRHIVIINRETTEMDNLNWISTGGTIGKIRRFPTFTIKINSATGMLVAFDETKNGSFFASSKTIESLEKTLRPYCNQRTQ
jgi:hypothetical protein